MHLRSLTILSLLAAGPAFADENLELSCDGVFGPTATHESVTAHFGADNVMVDQIAGDEGTYPEATVIYPTDPTRRLAIVWSDIDGQQRPNYVVVPEDSHWSLGGLRTNMPIAEVEKLNGRPFTLGGFDEIDRGAIKDFEGGKLSLTAGACRAHVEFRHPYFGTPVSLDDPVSGQGDYSSTDPTFHALGAKVRSIVLMYD
jgi:hypothetical protein